MNVWGITDRGVIREQNQDAFAHQVLPDGRVLALVCDGMGGARAGNVASTMAVDIIMDEFLAEEEGARTLDSLKAAAALANRRIFQRPGRRAAPGWEPRWWPPWPMGRRP